LTLSDVPLIASYDYTYKLPAIAADNRADITVAGHFWIVNLQKVLVFIVLPIFVLILLLVLRSWRKRQDRKYRTRLKAEAMQEARAALEREAAEARQAGPQGPYGGSGSGTNQ
jgi:membrane protein implicated in regulation of membrane protease activity